MGAAPCSILYILYILFFAPTREIDREAEAGPQANVSRLLPVQASQAGPVVKSIEPSHFSHDGIAHIINLQSDGSKAKKYQVRQIRKILREHLRGEKS